MKKDLKTWLPKNKKQGTWLPKLSSLKHWSSILYQFGFFIIFSDITDQSCWRRAKGADNVKTARARILYGYELFSSTYPSS